MLEAAQKNLNEGFGRHKSGEFDKALSYYNRILNESLVSELHSQTQRYAVKAEEKKVIKTAKEYYEEFKEAYYVSDLWDIAQEFKDRKRNEKRKNEVVLVASQKNIQEGMRRHKAGQFDDTLIYYNRNLNDTLDSSLKEQIQ